MFPTLFTYQGFGFHTWGLMVLMAFLAACLVTGARAGRVGIDSDKLVPFYLIITFAGLAGSRLLHFLFAETETFLANPGVFFDPNQGGFAFLGGVIGGVLAGGVYAIATKIPVLKLADVGAPSIMLGLAVGRTGCFFAGCCHGMRCELPSTNTLINLPGGSAVTVDGFPWLALQFVPGVGVGSIFNAPLFPTQLWEITGGLLMFAFLSWMWKKWRRFDGQVMAIGLTLYAIMRSFIEQFRGDSIRGIHSFDLPGLGETALSTSQIVAIGLVVFSVVLAAWRWPKGVTAEIPFEPEEDLD